MATYKNVGSSPWRRPSGEVVRCGRTFVATPREAARINRRAYLRARLLLVDDAPPPPLKQVEELLPEEKAAEILAAKAEAMEWPLVMLPDRYLKLHSQGKHAKLARKIVRAVKVGE